MPRKTKAVAAQSHSHIPIPAGIELEQGKNRQTFYDFRFYSNFNCSSLPIQFAGPDHILMSREREVNTRADHALPFCVSFRAWKWSKRWVRWKPVGPWLDDMGGVLRQSLVLLQCSIAEQAIVCECSSGFSFVSPTTMPNANEHTQQQQQQQTATTKNSEILAVKGKSNRGRRRGEKERENCACAE